MARLTWRRRKQLPRSDFAIPEKAPGPGSYPIPDRRHAANALGKSRRFGSAAEQRRVRGAVHRRFPSMGRS